jgi:catechol 2,3-dioxygenase-like lactoylglutathione lyase family enzyme
MERVTGIGGVFFRARDPAAIQRWYAEHLGVAEPPATYEDDVWWQEAGPTVWAAFPADARDLDPSGQAWMVNFRVADIDRMVSQLRNAGIDVEIDPEFYPNGRFASLTDPEANPIQLWQPARRAAGVRIDTVDAVDVFFRHVERFNDGVGTGVFDAMLEQFADDAVMVFEGGPNTSFGSRAEIADAYRSNPPDDRIVVLTEPAIDDGAVVAAYGWNAQRGVRAGHIRVAIAGRRITRVVITFD